MTRVTALVPARNEVDRIGATIDALDGLAVVDLVVVVDDASTDGTASAAHAAGARVIRTPRHAGKGRAMEGALRRTPQSDVWLFADGDLGPTGVALASVLAEVLDGRADLAIAAPPRQPGGGLGLVKTAAAYAIRASCGFEAAAPLSGQRAITAGALTRCRPLAGGFGVEVAMTIDAVRAGCRVIEIPADVMHRPTGRTLRGFAHRGRQGMDIGAAVAARLAAPR